MSVMDSSIKEVLNYDPISGDFTWIKTASNRRAAGQKAGCLCKRCGYLKIRYKNTLYQAHRLAWYFVHGDIPHGAMIDHIDRNRSNNAISNLRLVDNTQNSFNRNLKSTNTSGYTGVSFFKDRNKWRAYIVLNNRQKNLGYFETKEEAAKVYQDALEEVKKQIGLE